jgi:hypothetical protein
LLPSVKYVTMVICANYDECNSAQAAASRAFIV